MTPRTSLESEWEVFREKVIHPKAPQIQLQEMKRAFYAGAMVFYSILLTAMNSSSESSWDLLKNLEKEMTEYAESQRRLLNDN